MKCVKCKKTNNDNVYYCYYCGNPFTEEEQKQAKKQGIGGLLRSWKKFQDTINLNVITDKLWFRILSVFIILAIGIGNVYQNGTKFRIQENPNYTVKYHKKEKEYYIYAKNTTTPLSLYIPGNNDSIEIKYYDENNHLIQKNSYTKKDAIIVEANTIEDNYYVLIYHNKKIKLRVYNQ